MSVQLVDLLRYLRRELETRVQKKDKQGMNQLGATIIELSKAADALKDNRLDDLLEELLDVVRHWEIAPFKADISLKESDKLIKEWYGG